MAEIRVETGPVAFTSAGIKRPKAGVEGKFSLWFLAALALAEGQVTLDRFTDETVNDPRLIALQEKVKATMNRKLKFGAKVEVVMKDGTRYQGFRPTPKGDPANPLSFDELEQKFRSMAEAVLPEEKIQGLTEMIRHVDDLDDFQKMFTLVQ